MEQKHRVIIQFNSFEARDKWSHRQPQQVARVYKRNPWLAAEVSDEELQQLQRSQNIAVFPDVQTGPLPGAR